MKKLRINENYGKIIFGIFILFILIEIAFGNFHKIWGLKTEAMMDVWTIEHVLSGISVGFFIMSSNYKVFEKKSGFDPKKLIQDILI